MRRYLMRLGAAIAAWTTLLPAAAAARPVVTVGVHLPVPAPVVLVRPAQPAYGWVWVDGHWAVNRWGHPHFVVGHWAPPPRVVVAPVARRAVVVPAPVVHRRVVVRR